MSDKQHIDEYFKHGLRDMEITPPPDAWKNISKRLDKKRRVGVFYVWTALAAGIALLIGVGVLLRSSGDNTIKETIKPVALSKKVPESFTSEGAGNPSIPKSVQSPGRSADVDVNHAALKGNGYNVVLKQPSAHLDANVGKDSDIILPNDQSESSVAMVANPTVGESVKSLPDTTGKMLIANNVKNNGDTIASVMDAQPLLVDQISNQAVTPDPDETPKRYNKWSLSGQVTPLYAYRNANLSQNNERGLVSYSGGVKVDYKANKRLSIQAGVFYAVLGQTVDNVQVVTGLNSITNSVGQVNNKVMYVSAQNSMGSIVSNNAAGSKYYSTGNPVGTMYVGNDIAQAGNELGTAIQKLNYIEVPLLVRYKILENRQRQFGVHVMGGLGANFLVNNYVILQVNGESQKLGSTSDLNQLNCSGIVGLGVDYNIFRKIGLTIEPTYKYYLSSISVNRNIDFRPYSFGLFTGLIYKF
jgi:hypothetical protein